jgi:NAD(P)-dependent dehydrogenase (short-subunit alcohol dehydrogenase family)
MSSAAVPSRAFVVTGPTSGIGHHAALELARHGTVVLVGRSSAKLAAVQAEIAALPGGAAVPVVADFADLASVRRAADEIAALGLPLAGLLNNAGIMTMTADARTADDLDLSWVTNHLGPFLLTERLVPHLPDGARVVFVCSAVEDVDRRPARIAGFRGGRYLSAVDSAHGRWRPGGSKRPGMDAYATSKQANLATVLAFAREYPRLTVVGVEPGLNPGTGLSADAGPVLAFVGKHLLAPLAPMIKYWSTPQRAARVLTTALTGDTPSGTYLDEKGRPMQGSTQVRDPAFQDRLVQQTREQLAGYLASE